MSLASILTNTLFVSPSHQKTVTYWNELLVLTAADTVPDSHRIPFSSIAGTSNETKIEQKLFVELNQTNVDHFLFLSNLKVYCNIIDRGGSIFKGRSE